MGKRLTPDQWIRRATEIWGNRYDYSLARFVDTKTKLTVVCLKHGPWGVTPDNHLRGKRGCPGCGREQLSVMYTKPFADFLIQARRIHGDKYQYAENAYAGARKKLGITCQIHGIFFQSPEVHLRSGGCPKCSKVETVSNLRRQSSEQVNASISSLSDGKVSLDMSTFKNINQSASFRCSIHGVYSRLVNTVLNSKHPCIKCSRDMTLATVADPAAVLNEVQRRFGDKYKVEVQLGRNLRSTRITLVCTLHGAFELAYSSLARSAGCSVCARQSSQASRTRGLRLKNAQTLNSRASNWIERSKEVHQGKYDYSKAHYIDAKTSVVIICPIHGEFTQSPDTHLNSGCRACADDELLGKYSDKFFLDFPERRDIKAILYYVKMSYEKEVFFKVGITTTTLNNRFSMARSAGVKVEAISTRDLTLFEAFKAEKAIQASHGRTYRYRPKIGGKDVRSLRIGPSECFSTPLQIAQISMYLSG